MVHGGQVYRLVPTIRFGILEFMLELPEIELYIASLADRILDQPLQKVRLRSFFFVRRKSEPISSPVSLFG